MNKVLEVYSKINLMEIILFIFIINEKGGKTKCESN